MSAQSPNTLRGLEEAVNRLNAQRTVATRPTPWRKAGFGENFLRLLNIGTEGSVKGNIPFFSQLGEGIFGGISEEERTQVRSYSDLIELRDPLGEDATLGDKVGRFMVGLAADIFLDPITYVTLGARAGLSGLTKAGKAALGKSVARRAPLLATKHGLTEGAARRLASEQFMRVARRQAPSIFKGGMRWMGMEVPGSRAAFGRIGQGSKWMTERSWFQTISQPLRSGFKVLTKRKGVDDAMEATFGAKGYWTDVMNAKANDLINETHIKVASGAIDDGERVLIMNLMETPRTVDVRGTKAWRRLSVPAQELGAKWLKFQDDIENVIRTNVPGGEELLDNSKVYKQRLSQLLNIQKGANKKLRKYVQVHQRGLIKKLKQDIREKVLVAEGELKVNGKIADELERVVPAIDPFLLPSSGTSRLKDFVDSAVYSLSNAMKTSGALAKLAKGDAKIAQVLQDLGVKLAEKKDILDARKLIQGEIKKLTDNWNTHIGEFVERHPDWAADLRGGMKKEEVQRLAIARLMERGELPPAIIQSTQGSALIRDNVNRLRGRIVQGQLDLAGEKKLQEIAERIMGQKLDLVDVKDLLAKTAMEGRRLDLVRNRVVATKLERLRRIELLKAEVKASGESREGLNLLDQVLRMSGKKRDELLSEHPFLARALDDLTNKFSYTKEGSLTPAGQQVMKLRDALTHATRRYGRVEKLEGRLIRFVPHFLSERAKEYSKIAKGGVVNKSAYGASYWKLQRQTYHRQTGLPMTTERFEEIIMNKGTQFTDENKFNIGMRFNPATRRGLLAAGIRNADDLKAYFDADPIRLLAQEKGALVPERPTFFERDPRTVATQQVKTTANLLSSAGFYKRLIENGTAIRLNEASVKEILAGNPKAMSRVLRTGVDVTPKNQVSILKKVEDGKGIILDDRYVAMGSVERVLTGKAGYVKVNIPMMKGFIFGGEDAIALKRAISVLTERHESEGILKLYDDLTAVWKASVTMVWPAFHSRNFMSNIYLNWIGGVKDPRVYMLASEAQYAFAKGGKMMEKALFTDTHGKKWAVNEVLELAHKNGLISREYLYQEAVDRSADSITRHAAMFGHGALGMLGKVVNLGKKAGRLVEHNARLGHLIDKLAKGESVVDAVRSVKKHLFDYDRLTPFERKVMRRIVPFYCVPDHSEILTRDGWKHRKYLRLDEEVMTYNVERDCLEWQPCLDVATFPHDQELTVITSKRGVRLESTDNHRWAVLRNTSFVKGKWYGGDRRLIESRNLNTIHNVIMSSEYHGKDSLLTPEQARLYGWLLTDGYWRFRGNHCEAMIYQSPKKFLKEVIEVAGGTPRKPHPDTGVICVPVLKDRVVALLPYLQLGKDGCANIPAKLSREAIDAMYDAMYKGDGLTSVKRHQDHFAAQRPAVRECFRLLALMRGKRTTANSKRGCYVSNRRTMKVMSATIKKEHYQGIVWCPRTSNGTWVMRQNGTITITGNTFLRNNLPLQLEFAVTQPGKLSGLMKALKEAGSREGITTIENELLPDYVRSEPNIRLNPERGKLRFLAGLGIPLDDIDRIPMPFSSSFFDTLRKDMGLMNPIPKTIIETAFGVSTFTGQPHFAHYGFEVPQRVPTVLLSLPKSMRQLFNIRSARVEGEEVALASPRAAAFLRALPGFARAESLGKKLSDKDETTALKTLYALVGMTVREVDIGTARQRRGQRRRAEREQRRIERRIERE